MVDVATTFTVTFEHEPDQVHTRIVADLEGPIEEELHTFLVGALGVQWAKGGHQFDIALQYAVTASNHLTAAGVDATFRPIRVEVPPAATVEAVIHHATARADWPVSRVEILDESADFTFEDGLDRLVFHATCTAHVTQVKP